jgi:hypothetical protein
MTVRHLLAIAVLFTLCFVEGYAADGDDDTPKAAATRKKLKEKVSVDFKDTRLEDAIDDIKEQIKGLSILLDTKGGVSRNQTVSYKAKDKALDEVLDEMFKKSDLGYIVISRKGNAYDGSIQVRKSKERGFPIGKDK